jgi:adenylosuccinate lyase
MIERYTRPEMGGIWTQENKFRKWLDVEIAVCEAWAEEGKIPKKALKVIKEKADFTVERIDEIELEVKHDVIAFLTAVAENIGPESRFVHLGLTSSDVGDTAQGLLLKESATLIIKDIKAIMEALKVQALAHKDTPCIGRSHGVHAEPMTFGLKFALWYEEMGRNLKRLNNAKKAISVGKLSGAVGTFSNVPPDLEDKVLKKLGLAAEPLATQVVQRDRHAEYLSALAITAGTIEKIAIEIRHLQRTEVREAEEPFRKGQKGSSAMPHKRNPVGCENLTGLARIVRSNSLAAYENIALWHERDISHSSVERIILPDSSILVDYMLRRMTGIIRDMHIYPKRMLENMDISLGLHNSQRMMLALVEKGMAREDAYLIVQRNAMKCWKTQVLFIDLLKKDKQVMKYFKPAELKILFELEPFLKHIDVLFKRVFG